MQKNRNYYRIAGLTMEVIWENLSRKFLYQLAHDCSVMPRAMAAYEMLEEEPEQVDLSVRVRSIAPFTASAPGKRLGQEICYEEKDCFCLAFFLDFEHSEPGCSLRMSKDYAYAELIPHRLEGETFDLYRVQYAFECRMLQLGNLVVHGAAVEYQGKGIIFSGLSGAGKTTQAHLWKKCRNALILNGDCPAIRQDQGQILVCGTPWCGTSGEQIDRQVPLKAFVMVKQAGENRVRELVGREKFMTVLSQIFRSNTDGNTLDLAIANLERMIDGFQVYELCCTKDSQAVEVLERELFF